MKSLATRPATLCEHLRMHMAKECQDAANYIETLESAVLLMPDDIEVFRLMRLGGRSRADQARVVAARIENIRKHALAAGSGTAKTPQAAECEASQSGPKGNAQGASHD